MTKLMRIQVAIATLLADAALASCSTQVVKAKRAAAEAVGATEACYGVARAGWNDCKTSKHVCAGWSREARDRRAFIFLPEGTCEKIVGGRREES